MRNIRTYTRYEMQFAIILQIKSNSSLASLIICTQKLITYIQEEEEDRLISS